MALLEQEFARREMDGVETRPETRLLWSFDALPTTASHSLTLRFACGARVADTSPDRRMFAQVLLGARDTVTIKALIEHFEPALRSAAAKRSEQHPAIEWAEHQRDQEMLDALLAAAQSVAFAC